MSQHTPMMPDAQAQRLRRWQDDVYEQAGAEASGGPQTFDYLGLTLVVPPRVMPITRVSHLLGEAVLAEAGAGERVLDMGTGSGVNAILAASRGAAVLAVDLNPEAVEAARANAERNGVADRVEVRFSDVFSAVDGTFDLIIFDPPFRWFAPRSRLEMASTDENYRALTAFFEQAGDRLTPGGRMLIFFGTSGDAAYLRSLIDQHGFMARTVATAQLDRDGLSVEYFTLLVTP
jgi:release factor glutamine methyltransferase